MGTLGDHVNREATSGLNHKGERMDTWMRHQGTEHLVVAMKSGESGWSEGGGCREAKSVGPTSDGRSLKDKAKPYCILRREIWEAYLKVKSYKGAAGVDEQRIEDFEKDLKRNLYIVWNRMSSGSYFSSPVVTIR